MIADGHEKLSAPDWLPIDLIQLIDILESRDSSDAQRWAESLRTLNFVTANEAPPRFDMLVYVCGQKPARASQIAWMPTDQPHEKYTGGKSLAAVEIQFDDFVSVLAAAYPGAP